MAESKTLRGGFTQRQEAKSRVGLGGVGGVLVDGCSPVRPSGYRNVGGGDSKVLKNHRSIALVDCQLFVFSCAARAGSTPENAAKFVIHLVGSTTLYLNPIYQALSTREARSTRLNFQGPHPSACLSWRIIRDTAPSSANLEGGLCLRNREDRKEQNCPCDVRWPEPTSDN